MSDFKECGRPLPIFFRPWSVIWLDPFAGENPILIEVITSQSQDSGILRTQVVGD